MHFQLLSRVFRLLSGTSLQSLYSYVSLSWQIVLPPHLENIRDKLAENIHELWGMNKIELGWTYGKVKCWIFGNRVSSFTMGITLTC